MCFIPGEIRYTSNNEPTPFFPKYVSTLFFFKQKVVFALKIRPLQSDVYRQQFGTNAILLRIGLHIQLAALSRLSDQQTLDKGTSVRSRSARRPVGLTSSEPFAVKQAQFVEEVSRLRRHNMRWSWLLADGLHLVDLRRQADSGHC